MYFNSVTITKNKIDPKKVLNCSYPKKDVDGFISC